MPYKESPMVRNQGDTIGLLVGAPKPYILPHQIQHELVAALCHVPDDGGKDSARSYRSIWKSSHGYNDLLYRVSESAIVLSSPDGEVVVELRRICRVRVADQSMYFVCAKPYRILGFSGCGGKLIQ